MHLAGRDFSMQQPNLRGLVVVERNRARGPAPPGRRSQAQLLQAELAYQNHIADSKAPTPACRAALSTPICSATT